MKRCDMGISTVGAIAAVVLLSGCGPDSRDNEPTAGGPGETQTPGLIGTKWEWVGTVTPVERIEAAAPERYSILLDGDGSVIAQLDCNSGRGTYETEEYRISFGVFITTRMACPEDTQDILFARELEEVSTFFLQDGQLFLEMPFDSGTMRFRPANNAN